MNMTLKAARVNIGISQESMAKLMGVSKSTICRWETGKLEIPQKELEVFCKICKVSSNNIRMIKEA